MIEIEGMFVFENLEVYKKALNLYGGITSLPFKRTMEDRIIAKQLIRASLSISLNIAEGSGKEGKRDRRNFLLISRGSLYESVAILNVLISNKTISKNEYLKLYSIAEEISKMLYVMIKNIEKEIPNK